MIYKGKSVYKVGGGSPSPSNVVVIDGVAYPYVKIGGQLWLAKNLEIKQGNWIDRGTILYEGTPVSIDNVEYWLPDGWVIPSTADFYKLYDYVNAHKSGSNGVGYYLKSVDYGGNNEFGFNAYQTGSYIQGSFFSGDTDYWTSTEPSTNSRVRWELRYGVNSFTSSTRKESNEYIGIRLVKNL